MYFTLYQSVGVRVLCFGQYMQKMNEIFFFFFQENKTKKKTKKKRRNITPNRSTLCSKCKTPWKLYGICKCLK